MYCASRAHGSFVETRMYEATDALPKNGNVEIDQKTNRQTRELQVSDHLRLVDLREGFYSLHFDQHCVLNNQIDDERGLEWPAFVDQRVWTQQVYRARVRMFTGIPNDHPPYVAMVAP